MPPTIEVIVNVIGWKPRPSDSAALQPQFINPVPARLYLASGVRMTTCWLRLDSGRVVATLAEAPADARSGSRLRSFCCTEREYEPRTRLARRRITSIDIVVIDR